MLDWLKRTKLPDVWAIKQVDDDLLHLCGRGRLKTRERPANAIEALRQNRFEGAIQLHDTPLLLNARLFAALAMVDELALNGQDRATWHGREYRVSWVPQRCWTYEGRLTTTSSVLNEVAQLVSVEDVSAIRDKAAAQEGNEPSAHFASLEARLHLPGTPRPPFANDE